jgi:hypothetical protein
VVAFCFAVDDDCEGFHAENPQSKVVVVWWGLGRE